MFGLPTTASINHLLRGAPWALEKLSSHAGKTIVVKFGPISLRLTVEADGALSSAGSELEADVTIDVPPALAMRLVTQGRDALNEAPISGDTALAQTLGYIAQNLQWDYEEDLSKVVGDIAAYRIGSAARIAKSWVTESADSFMQMSKDFWTEERPTIAKSTEVATFVASVDDLRDAVARLEKRIELMEKAANQS